MVTVDVYNELKLHIDLQGAKTLTELTSVAAFLHSLRMLVFGFEPTCIGELMLKVLLLEDHQFVQHELESFHVESAILVQISACNA